MTHREDVESMLKAFEFECQTNELIPATARLSYQPGSKINGISPAIEMRVDGQMVQTPHWFPKYTLKTDRREVEKMLAAAIDIFYAFRMRDQERQRQAQKDLLEAE